MKYPEKVVVYSKYHHTNVVIENIGFDDGFLSGIYFICDIDPILRVDISYLKKIPTYDSNNHVSIYPNELTYRLYNDDIVLLLSAKIDNNMLGIILIEIMDVYTNVLIIPSNKIRNIDFMRRCEIESFESNLRKNKLKFAISI